LSKSITLEELILEERMEGGRSEDWRDREIGVCRREEGGYLRFRALEGLKLEGRAAAGCGGRDENEILKK
jgi:hypothetical protein